MAGTLSRFGTGVVAGWWRWGWSTRGGGAGEHGFDAGEQTGERVDLGPREVDQERG